MRSPFKLRSVPPALDNLFLDKVTSGCFPDFMTVEVVQALKHVGEGKMS